MVAACCAIASLFGIDDNNNGLELVREIRSRQFDVPVLLTSGYAEAVRQPAEAEGVAILAKPYRLEELASALVTALERVDA